MSPHPNLPGDAWQKALEMYGRLPVVERELWQTDGLRCLVSLVTSSALSGRVPLALPARLHKVFKISTGSFAWKGRQSDPRRADAPGLGPWGRTGSFKN